MKPSWCRLFLLCPFLLLTGCAAGATPTPKKDTGPVDVLFIGNSYVFVNRLPQMFANLATSGGHEVHTRMAAKGGWTLEQHVESEQTMDRIASQEWDYVVLQEQSVLPSLPAEREAHTYPAARALHQAIVDQGAQTVFMMTWGRRDGLPQEGFADFGAMQAQLAAGYQTIGQELGAPVAPVGLAWQRAIEDRPGVALWDADGSHPALSGSYLAACVLYATLFGESPEGLDYHADLSPDEAQFLQAVAAQTAQ